MRLRRTAGALAGAVLAAAALSALPVPSSAAPAQAAPANAAPASGNRYDGRWSVEVITDEGTCDRAYRWSIGIKGGRVADIADGVATANGTIDKSGKVALRFERGADILTAKGSLDAENGSGLWTAPSRACSGRWRAERRG